MAFFEAPADAERRRGAKEGGDEATFVLLPGEDPQRCPEPPLLHRRRVLVHVPGTGGEQRLSGVGHVFGRHVIERGLQDEKSLEGCVPFLLHDEKPQDVRPPGIPGARTVPDHRHPSRPGWAEGGCEGKQDGEPRGRDCFHIFGVWPNGAADE